jgi:hypothetical protein
MYRAIKAWKGGIFAARRNTGAYAMLTQPGSMYLPCTQ